MNNDMEMSDKGVFEYGGGGERLKILQSRKIHSQTPPPPKARRGPIRNASKYRTQAQQRKDRMKARWNSGDGSSGSRVPLGKPVQLKEMAGGGGGGRGVYSDLKATSTLSPGLSWPDGSGRASASVSL